MFEQDEPCPNCDTPLIFSQGWIICPECEFEQELVSYDEYREEPSF